MSEFFFSGSTYIYSSFRNTNSKLALQLLPGDLFFFVQSYGMNVDRRN